MFNSIGWVSNCYEVHNRKEQMTHGKANGQHRSRQVLAVDGKKDERQTGREGQQENHPRSGGTGIVLRPAKVIRCYTSCSSNDQRRETELAPLFADDEAEARHGQHLENGADDVHHRRDGLRPQNVIRRGDGKPNEIREHHQQKEEKPPKVKAEAVAGILYNIHFQINT